MKTENIPGARDVKCLKPPYAPVNKNKARTIAHTCVSGVQMDGNMVLVGRCRCWWAAGG